MLLSDESREVAARAVSELNVPPVHGGVRLFSISIFLSSRHTWQLATSKVYQSGALRNFPCRVFPLFCPVILPAMPCWYPVLLQRLLHSTFNLS